MIRCSSTTALAIKCTRTTPLDPHGFDHQGFIGRTLSLNRTCGIRPEYRAGHPVTYFRVRPGTKSTVFKLKKPFPDIAAFDSAVRSLVLKNPLECTSYRSVTKNHPPVEVVREMYTARFVYRNAAGKQVGRGSEVYDSADGYATGIAAVISNMANIASHRGRVAHTPDADRFSVLLKCHDPGYGHYFMSLARTRITLSSYDDDEIRRRTGAWVKGVLAK